MDGKDNDDDSDRAHRKILEEGVHNEVHEENRSRSTHRCFHQENARRNMAKLLIGVVDGTMESAHSKDARARSVHLVPRALEMPMEVHKAHDGCQNWLRDQKIHGTLNFRNAAEKDRCSDLGVEDLRNAKHLESSDETNCEKLETSSGVQSRRKIRPLRVDEVCPE